MKRSNCKQLKKVICFGTFDLFHLGHLNYFKQAKKYGNYLVVVMARDKTKEKMKKKIFFSEKERLALVKSVKIVDKVILGDKQNFLKPILKEKPVVVCLGYDHKLKVRELQKKLSKLGLFPVIKRAKAYLPNKYKSTHLRKIFD